LGDVYHNIEYKDSSSVVKDAKNIETKDLIVGDLVYLTIGDIVHADIRILVSKNFQVNQSTLTGEVTSINKTGGVVESNIDLLKKITFVIWELPLFLRQELGWLLQLVKIHTGI
jgi:Cation transport ATPase